MQMAVARGRGRPKCVADAVQSDIIINCARRLFVQKGYGATTTEDIAAECKISKQTLYRLFPAKANLFSAVVRAHRQKWLDLPREDDHQPLAETMAKIFMVDIAEEADRERIDVIRLVLAEGRNFPELAEIQKQQGVDFSRRLLADWLQQRCDRGEIKLQETLGAAQILLDMVFGAMVVNNMGNVDWPGGAQRRAHIHQCINIFLHGVGAAR